MERSVRHITRSLHVPLSFEQRDEELKNMLDCMEGRNGCLMKIDILKSQAKSLQSNIVVFDQDIEAAAYKLKHGILQDVPCRMILNWKDRRILISRKDTEEIIEDREMTDVDKPEAFDEIDEAETVRS